MAAQAAIIGVISGIGGAALAAGLFSVLNRSESGEPFSIADLVGDEVYVSVGIPAGRYGTVLAKKEGMTHEFTATADADIPTGRTVRVVGTAGAGLIVHDEHAALPRPRARSARCSTGWSTSTAGCSR